MAVNIESVFSVTHVSRSLLCAALICMPVALAQCYDGTTTLTTTENVVRSGSNQVWTFAQSYVTGDYADTWTANVSATTTVNGTQVHSGQASADDGNIATVQWHDTPSSLGAGAYAESDHHTFSDTCGDNEGPYNYNPSLTVNLPTISGFGPKNAIWNFGPGSADPVPGYNNQNIAQSSALTFNTNCNAGDTCTDTPQWSITSDNGQAALNSTSGSSVTLEDGSDQGDCAYDTTLSASMGGFSTNTYAILVNSPQFLVHVSSSDNTIGYGGANPFGYGTEWTIGLEDACAPPNGIYAVPMNESFSGTPYIASGTTGWDVPNTALMSWSVGAWISEYTFQDAIGYSCENGSCTPQATWTAANPPFTYNTVLTSQSHQFFSGTTTQSQGWRVYSGTIEYYRDHGDNTCSGNPGC